MKTVALNEQAEMPVLGLGTWQLRNQACVEAVKTALEVGYRHIDTAIAYGNHADVARAIGESGITRDELFITSKIPPSSLAREDLLRQTERALKELATDYLDLLLIHWPNSDIPAKETLQTMHELRGKGKVRAIGVSNFTIPHLQEALRTGVGFSINQVEYHPSLNQQELKAFCDEHNIIVTAYSPIGRGEDLQLDVIQELAAKYGRSPSQVILNWLVSKGMVVIPKASSREHIEDNFQALEWQLETGDVAAIDAIDSGDNRLVAPAHAEFDKE